MQGPVYPSFLYSTNHSSGHSDAGNSCLALLYGPPTLLQCDLQELSDQKLCSSYGNPINCNSQGWADTSADISSRAMVGLSGASNYVFHDTQSSNTVAQHTFPGGVKARESFYSRRQCHVTSPASRLNVCCSNTQTTSEIALEQGSSKHANPFMSGCPRVFCMGKSGYLLLSNTGLLGIVCSCHCCHMSVLKFCEHSGLHGVNPGDAVCLESGETIAQWRKLYFLKLGIRSLGNENEWDWPEVLSTTGSLMKPNASASDMSKSDLSRILSSPAVTLRKQITTIQDGCNIPLKGFSGISQNMYERVKSQLMESNLAMYTTAPNFGGTQQDDGCQPITPLIGLSIARSSTQTQTSLLKDHECIIKKNARDGLVGRDAASSNIELRLGQPPQTGNPVPSFIEPPLLNASAIPQKSQPLKHMINNADLSREELQNNFSYVASSLKLVEEQPLLKHGGYMSGVGNALDAARAGSQTENVAKSLLFSPFPQFTAQPKGKTKTSENRPIMHQKPHSEYSTMQFGPTNVLCCSNVRTGKQSINFALGSNKYLDNDKGVGFAKDSCAKINSEFGISQFTKFCSNPRAVGSDSCISAVNGKIYESSLSSDTSVGANFLQGSKNVSSFEQDHPMTSGTSIPFEGISKGHPYLVSSSMANQTPTLLQQQDINMGTYMPDENMSSLAFTQILELPKQQHALYFHDMNQKQGKSSNISKAQHYIYEASTSERGTFGTSLKLPQHRGDCGNHKITDGLDQRASFTGLNRYCLSALAPIPLLSKEIESQCKCSYDLRNDVPSLSLGIIKDNTGSSAFEKCSEQPSDVHLVDKYTCATPVNCSARTSYSRIEPSHYILKPDFENASGEASLKIAAKCSGDENASKGGNTHFELSGKLDSQGSIKVGSHTPQWRDVPSKVREVANDATSLDQRATVLDCEGQGSIQLGNFSVKRLKRTIDVEDLFKEQENFNVSSRCSAPVVSQASVEVNKVDSCTVDDVGTGCVENLVVDEGSGIDKGWSSDVVESERSAEFLGSTSGSNLKRSHLGVSSDQPCRSLLDELKLLDSLTWKKGWDQSHIMLSANFKANQSQKFGKRFKGKKRKGSEMILDAPLPSGIPTLLHNENGESTGVFNTSSSLSKEIQMYFSSSQKRSSNKASFAQPSVKQRGTAFSSRFLSYKNHLSKHHSNKASYDSESNDAGFHTSPEVSGIKKLRKDFTPDCLGNFEMQELCCMELENGKLRSFCSRKANAHRVTRPVVCGEYGEISSGQSDGEVPKPAKIVSLSKVLELSKKCTIPMSGKPRLTSKKKWKRLSFGTSSGHCCVKPGLKIKEGNETQNTINFNQANVCVSMEDLERGSKPHVIYKGNRDAKAKQGDSIGNRADALLKVKKSKEIRKQRSINELTAKETKVKDISQYAEDREHGLYNTKCRNFVQEDVSISIINSDAFCCVCRSSSNDKINCLLECSKCQIRVHQACYGISTLPKKGRWCCRPCRTNSKETACVLCGYGGGAMTRALLSNTIVKSLLKVWNIDKEVDAFHSSKLGLKVHQACGLRAENVDMSTVDLLEVEMSTNHMQNSLCSASNFKVHNSITAGVLDTTVKQWVHMVCGLWTPQTRCPNVDTMSAFDVSSVSRPRADVVCSICNRWGGSCIECRIVDCSVKFHPWCAHQKNLLQSETEGFNDENIGFYGRCARHAIDLVCLSARDPIDEMIGREEKEFSCARTEGFKGRRWDGFHNNHYSALKAKRGCLFPEEQLNAWIHMNGQKLCSQGLPKFPDSDIEQDCRKEYARYKQAKGWKHLVVYKSGIHALGLYTSRFISRGEMVVEYVGEIVGQRVADKRENEYHSGRKVQYKSACYFFRIDKEHIVDATRKGGIARFVNHSCLPNCVARVITVRHEKKVVFFAERDIFPGEEITYDYHFNHEDEGKKIPCYCNSKNCRRYLN